MSTHRILHVDDNEMDLQLVELSLRKRAPDLEVVQTDSVQKCLEIFSEVKPHCILSDYQMPGMTGLDLLFKLREDGKDIPFIFLTGQGNEQLAVEALRAGADDYYSKEESFAQYERLINSLKRLSNTYLERHEHKKDQSKLRESEERFRLVSKASTDFIFEWYPDTNILTWFGDIFTTLGYSKEELGHTAQEFIRLIHPEDVYLAEEVIKTRSEIADPFEIEYRIKNRKDKYLHFQVRGQAVVDENGKPIKWVGACKDNSKHRKYEEDLQFKSFLLDHIQDAVTATDLDGKITYVNAAELKAMKKTEKDILGENVRSYGENPEYGASQSEIIEQTLRKGQWRGRIANIVDDGSEIIMDCRTQLLHDRSGQPVGMVGISTDITNSAVNSVSAKSLTALLENLDQLFLIVHVNGRIQAASSPVAAIFDSRPEELRNKTIAELKPANSMAEIIVEQMANRLSVLDNVPGSYNVDTFALSKPYKGKKTVQIKKTMFLNELNKPAGMCFIFYPE